MANLMTACKVQCKSNCPLDSLYNCYFVSRFKLINHQTIGIMFFNYKSNLLHYIYIEFVFTQLYFNEESITFEYTFCLLLLMVLGEVSYFGYFQDFISLYSCPEIQKKTLYVTIISYSCPFVLSIQVSSYHLIINMKGVERISWSRVYNTDWQNIFCQLT